MTLDVEGGRSDTGFRCVAREGLLFSPHCKMCSVVRSVIMVPSPHSFENLFEQLGALARMDPKSPRTEEKIRTQKGWASREENLRGQLQLEIDTWWEKTTDTHPKAEDSPTEFSNFLEHAFSALPAKTDFLHSRAAVEKRRRDAVRDMRKTAEIGRRIMKNLEKRKIL